MSVCLAGAGLAAQIAASVFTLAWTHTVQKTTWEEDWRIENGLLVLAEARVQGSGAGMEPPPEAHLDRGFYVWAPNLPPQTEIVLRRAAQAGDWVLCTAGKCGPLRKWLGGDADPVTVRPCSEE